MEMMIQRTWQRWRAAALLVLFAGVINAGSVGGGATPASSSMTVALAACVQRPAPHARTVPPLYLRGGDIQDQLPVSAVGVSRPASSLEALITSSVAEKGSSSAPRFRALIIDVEGALLETEPAVDKMLEGIAEFFGKELTADTKRAVQGATACETLSIAAARLGLTARQQEAVCGDFLSALNELLPHVPAMAGAHELVEHVRACGIPVAFVAGCTSDSLAALATGPHSAMFELASAIVCPKPLCAEAGVESGGIRGRPNADAYLRAAQRMNVETRNCLCLNGSPLGVEAAVRAGMCAVGVLPPRIAYLDLLASQASIEAKDLTSAGARAVVSSLAYLDPCATGYPASSCLARSLFCTSLPAPKSGNLPAVPSSDVGESRHRLSGLACDAPGGGCALEQRLRGGGRIKRHASSDFSSVSGKEDLALNELDPHAGPDSESCLGTSSSGSDQSDATHNLETNAMRPVELPSGQESARQSRLHGRFLTSGTPTTQGDSSSRAHAGKTGVRDESDQKSAKSGDRPEVVSAIESARRKAERLGLGTAHDSLEAGARCGADASEFEDGEAALEPGCVFDCLRVGNGTAVVDGGRTLTKLDETWIDGEKLGYGDGVCVDTSQDPPARLLFRHPTTTVWGREQLDGDADEEQGVVRWDILIRKLFGGNFFVGLAEMPITGEHNGADNFANRFTSSAWMLTDLGSIFRTGQDAGRAGNYYDGSEYDGVSAKVMAMATGFEMLTEQLKRQLMHEYPEVLTPGIWAFRDNAVVSMVHDRRMKTLTFLVNDSPPVTVPNVSNHARPFVNMLFSNDTITLLTPEENSRFRKRWQLKRRGPEDPDYWLWDWERWTPKDGGFVFSNGEWVHDPSIPNQWLPEYDHTDGRSPIPGMSLFEYVKRREEYDDEIANKRRRERDRQERRALEAKLGQLNQPSHDPT